MAADKVRDREGTLLSILQHPLRNRRLTDVVGEVPWGRVALGAGEG